ncbi:MAG: hypothetical protein M3Y91_05210 [Actinomycetota bacterium]|nr:hypothetical protein [Actinomycetota bacterium]
MAGLLIVVSLVALGSVAAGPSASAARAISVPQVHATPGPAPIPGTVLNRPRGFVYRARAQAATRSGPTVANNPACGTCQPPLLFTADKAVMGNIDGTPGHATITPVYWAPAGYSFPGSYQSIVDGYLSNVAAASHTNGNVFSVADQYYQQASGGPAQHIDYAVTAGTEVDVADAYPAQSPTAGCTADTGYSACVADKALQVEVNNTLTARGLTADDAHLYMVFFPPGVETCSDYASSPGVACSANQYCGYHSDFDHGPATSPALYANMPFPTLAGCADPYDGPQAPNGDPYADAAVSVVSHEANEAITDSFGAWVDANNFEDGDECSYTYGVALGSTGVAAPGATGTMYNQTINGAHYFTQDEFSNADYALGRGDVSIAGRPVVPGCIQRPDGPTAAASYHPLPPTRIADTRPLSGLPGAGQTLGPQGTLAVQVTGHGGVPTGATGVVLNVTAANPSSSSYFTVYPSQSARPLASTVDFAAGTTVPNLVDVGLGSNGQAAIFNYAGSADAVVDVEGYSLPSTAPGGAYHALSPARVADTRPASGQSNAGQTLGPGGVVHVQVTGTGGVPLAGAAAVVLNVTAVSTSASGYLTAYPGGTLRPKASNVNVSPGQTVSNRVIVPVGADDTVDVYNNAGSADVVIDVSGWFDDGTISPATGASFVATGPNRLADTRPRSGKPDAGMTVGPGGSVTVPVTSVGGVPAQVSAVVLNVTVTDTAGSSYLTAYPSGEGRPLASDLTWEAGNSRANLTVVRPGSDGTITIYNRALTTDMIVDVTGYYQ